MSKILMVILMVNLLSMPIQCPQRKKCQKNKEKQMEDGCIPPIPFQSVRVGVVTQNGATMCLFHNQASYWVL